MIAFQFVNVYALSGAEILKLHIVVSMPAPRLHSLWDCNSHPVFVKFHRRLLHQGNLLSLVYPTLDDGKKKDSVAQNPAEPNTSVLVPFRELQRMPMETLGNLLQTARTYRVRSSLVESAGEEQAGSRFLHSAGPPSVTAKVSIW